MSRRRKNTGWLVTLGIGAAIAVVAVKFTDQIKEMVKDVPVIGDFVNS